MTRYSNNNSNRARLKLGRTCRLTWKSSLTWKRKTPATFGLNEIISFTANSTECDDHTHNECIGVTSAIRIIWMCHQTHIDHIKQWILYNYLHKMHVIHHRSGSLLIVISVWICIKRRHLYCTLHSISISIAICLVFLSRTNSYPLIRLGHIYQYFPYFISICLFIWSYNNNNNSINTESYRTRNRLNAFWQAQTYTVYVFM